MSSLLLLLSRRQPRPAFAIDLNGSTEYMTRSSPNNLDLNGAERITNANNRGFETNIGDWVGNGNHSVIRNTTDAFPPNLFVNGDFSSSAGFTLGGGWTISGGKAHSDGTQASFSDLSRISSVGVVGQAYLVTFTISDYVSGTLTFRNSSTSLTARSGNGTYTEISVYAFAFPTLSLRASADFVGSVDDVKVEKLESRSGYSMKITSSGAGDGTTNFASLPYSAFTSLVAGEKYTVEMWLRAGTSGTHATVVIGSQSKTITTISTTPGTFTKYVFNFQATASEVNQNMKVFFNQADSIYVDDVSIRQRYDREYIAYFKTGTTGTRKDIVGRFASSSGIELYVNTSNRLEARIGGGTGNVVTVTGSATVTGNVVHLARLVVNSTGNAQIFLNGVADGSAVSVQDVGVISSGADLRIGFITNYFNGLIGTVEVLRDTERVAFYNWQGSTSEEMLQDKSGNGNHLTGVNVDINDRVKLE